MSMILEAIQSLAVPAFIFMAPPMVPGVPTANSKPETKHFLQSLTTRASDAPAPTV